MPTTLEPGRVSGAMARGDRFEYAFESFLRDGAGAQVPEDLTGRTYRVTFRSASTDGVLAQTGGTGAAAATVGTAVGQNGTVRNRVTVVVADTRGWPLDQVKWDLEETVPGVDGPQTVLIGTWQVCEDQSR